MNQNNRYKIILFYKYVQIKDPETLMNEQKLLCQKLGLKGRTIIANEGINATLEGLEDDISRYIVELKKDNRFEDLHIKFSEGTGEAFPKLSIRVRNEIVTAQLGEADIDPTVTTGKYLTPEELHGWIHSGKKFFMVDMRNDYEHKSGFFKDALLPPLKNFRDLPDILPQLEHLKDKTVVTYCTGGVRCEKASGFLVSSGFKDVYQLYGGIHSYMEKYPNEDFLGKLYVFDGRITMSINPESPDHQIVGRCELCGAVCDQYANCAYPRCNKHLIACTDCRDQNDKAYCSDQCIRMHEQYRNEAIIKEIEASEGK